MEIVALRKESVDRNTLWDEQTVKRLIVALRKESVDRNCQHVDCLLCARMSLSARRAWIEIQARFPRSRGHARVALRKESVDRNEPILSVAPAL